MDRLLTPNEQPNIPQDAFSIYDWKTALQTESHINEVKKLQDAKTIKWVVEKIDRRIAEQERVFDLAVRTKTNAKLQVLKALKAELLEGDNG